MMGLVELAFEMEWKGKAAAEPGTAPVMHSVDCLSAAGAAQQP